MRAARIVLLFGIAMIFVFMIIGNMFSPPNCFNIGECKECWSNVETYESSEYCSEGGSCKTVPYIDQHNALIDVLNCACLDASDAQYTDPETNTAINNLYRTLTGATATTQDVCSGSGQTLVKMYYS